MDGLIFLRQQTLGLTIAPLVVATMYGLIVRCTDGHRSLHPWPLSIIGLLALLSVSWIRRRPLSATSRLDLRRSFRKNFALGALISLVPVLAGGAFAISRDCYWPVPALFGYPFSVAAAWMMAPTKRNLAWRQAEISASGSPLSLIEALRMPAATLE